MAMDQEVSLEKKEYGLVLTDGTLELYGDYTKLIKRVKKNVIGSELLVKAVKMRGKENLQVLDATAGLGEDSFLLAAAGWDVILCEHNEVIFELLRDTIERAQETEEISEIANRMHPLFIDGVTACESVSAGTFDAHPNVIFLDPMFPKKTKNSLTNKKLQLFQKLESPCSTEEELFAAACKTNAAKVVVKRPVKGTYLAGKKPSHSIAGKTVRYDCYVL